MSLNLTDAELAVIEEQLRMAGVDTAGRLTSTLIAGGRSNLTFRLDDGADAWVLRMPPRAGRTPSAHDVAREFTVTRSLSRTSVPVARPILLAEDEALLGGPFTVSEFVRGRCISSREDLDALSDTNIDRVVTALVSVLAELHGVDHVAAGLAHFGRPDGYAARQLRRWSGQWDLVGAPNLEGLAAELKLMLSERLPRQRSVGIVHGDFRIDNALLHIDDPVEVKAVLDWELSTIGDPVADVALMCVYRDPLFDLILGSPSAWTSNRLPNPDDLAARYLAAGGVPLDHWEFQLGLAAFKLGVIAAGIDHRYRAGATHGEGFATAGDAVAPLLEKGLALLA